MADTPVTRVLLVEDREEAVILFGPRDQHLRTLRDALGVLADYSMVRWDVDGETVAVHRVVQEILRTRLPGGTEPVTFGVRHAELRHAGADWSAEAQVVLPASLGESVHVALQMRGVSVALGS